MKTAIIAAAAAATALGGQALAQQQGQPQTPPPNVCETEEGYARFDFWLGEWDVFAAGTDQKAGENSITKEEGGCLIVERWTSAQGTTGQSYNYYNPVTDEWRQVWVSSGAIIDYTGGLNDAGAMRLDGTITYRRTGQTADFFGEWTLLEDGTVRQHFEQHNSETDEWAPWFTGIYRRKAE